MMTIAELNILARQPNILTPAVLTLHYAPIADSSK